MSEAEAKAEHESSVRVRSKDEAIELDQLRVVGELADDYLVWTSLYFEMESVRKYLRGLRSKANRNRGDEIAGALWRAAIIAYGRSFQRGRRRGYVIRVPIPSELDPAHRSFLRERNEEVAHDGLQNTSEGGVVMVLLDPRGRRLELPRIANLLIGPAYPAYTRQRELGSLARHFGKEFWARAMTSRSEIAQLVRRMPHSELLAEAARGGQVVATRRAARTSMPPDRSRTVRHRRHRSRAD
jgi:hypothetical protein